MAHEMSGKTEKTQVLILGGGFAGAEAARYLDQTAAKRSDVEVTLVSRDNFVLFTPMLHEVASGDLDPGDICNPLRKLLRNVTVLNGEVRAIDLAARQVTISYGLGRLTRELPFDHLVLALGSETDYFGTPGVAEHALGIKTIGDAIMLRAKVIAMLEAASVEPDPVRRKPMLTFVVVGGGFAGVETIGAINDFARDILPHYGRVDPGEVRVVLVHGGAVILPELGEELGLYAQEKLRERRVEIKLKTKALSYADRAVHCSDGEAVPTDTIVWAAGISPSPILKQTPLQLYKGRVVVDSTLEVPQFPGIWALGDCAAVIDPASKLPYPPTAQHALREGRRVAKNICARLQGEQSVPFVYKAPGQLAAIGRRTGVARIFGLNISGFVGWSLWRSIYLMKLPRIEKRLRVAVQWALDAVFKRDLGQFITWRDVASLNRIMGAAQRDLASSSPGVPPAASPPVSSKRIAS